MEINYSELFGLDVGENEQEVADPAEDLTEETQGENEQEVADPVETETQTIDGEEEESETEEDTATDAEDKSKPKQTKEDRARYAAARRKAEAERDAAIAKERAAIRAEADKVIDQAFADSGLINPYTKQPIRSKAEYDEYRKRHAEEQKSHVQKKSGMSEDEFNEFVEGLPQVRAAREAQRVAKEQEAKAKIEGQLREINALDPSIKTTEDLLKMPTYDAFYRFVKEGNNFVNAFKLANFERLTSDEAAKARQAATNAARSKDHLSRTTTRGAGAVSVPENVKAEYLAFNPDATEAEILKHYNKYLKK